MLPNTSSNNYTLVKKVSRKNLILGIIFFLVVMMPAPLAVADDSLQEEAMLKVGFCR
jgi:hypothetical protein